MCRPAGDHSRSQSQQISGLSSRPLCEGVDTQCLRLWTERTELAAISQIFRAILAGMLVVVSLTSKAKGRASLTHVLAPSIAARGISQPPFGTPLLFRLEFFPNFRVAYLGR